MTLLVQKYLETHTLEQLKADHGVNYRFSSDGMKFSLNYDMLEASNTDPLASQCRGVVLAHDNFFLEDDGCVVGHTEILARTMDRFFNLGQDCAAEVDFAAHGTRFYEKLDGTMCALYYDHIKQEWSVATRSVPEADLPIDGFDNMTFRGLFEKAIQDTTGYHFVTWVKEENLYYGMTYVFELCTPANRIVVEHDEYKVALLAIRHTDGGEEKIDDPGYTLRHVPLCPSYELNNLADMIEFVSGRDPLQYEGIVAVDKNWNRVKVKNAEYIALSRAKDSAMRSPRALVELCLLGKLDDALPLLPNHIQERAHKIEEALRGFIRHSNDVYMKIGGDAINMCDENGWDSTDEKTLRKAVALSAQAAGEWLPYIMLRYQGQVNSFGDYAKLQVDSQSGCHKKSFLDALLAKLELE